ncbi:hypothetical protein BJX96DRAFT_162325 [Aspergillus floccosus]
MEQRLCTQANRAPDAIAIEDGNFHYSYREMILRADVLALELRRKNVQIEEPICVFQGPGSPQILSQIAVLRSGGTCVPIDPCMPDFRLSEMLAELGVRVVITTDELRSRLPPVDVLLVEAAVQYNPPTETSSTEIPLMAGCPPTHCAHLLFTSGSSGKPKAVKVSAAGILHLATHCPMSFLPTDRMGQFNNPGFDMFLMEVWATLLSGATIVSIPTRIITDPFAVGEFLRRNRVTGLIIPSSLFTVIATHTPTAFGTLRHLLVGGEAANVKAFRKVAESGSPPEHFWNGYGPTEFSCAATVFPVTSDEVKRSSISIGGAFGENKVYLLDDEAQPVWEPDREGEICLAGPGLSPGYYNRPEENARKFPELDASLFGGEPNVPIRLYRTGDLGKWRQVGRMLDFVGRTDGQIKRFGFRVELGDIERTLEKHAHVEAAVVIYQKPLGPDEPDLLVATVNVSSNYAGSFSASDIIDWAKGKLPYYMIPNRVYRVERIPTTPQGKVDRRKLLDMMDKEMRSTNGTQRKSAWKLSSSTLCRDEDAAATLRSLLLCVLGIDDIGPDDDVMALGLSSLGAAKLLGLMRAHTGVVISMQQLHENPTLRQLAHLVNPRPTVNYGPSEILQWEADSHLGDGIDIPRQTEGVPDWLSEGKVFLTGATGFIGGHILAQLLNMPSVTEVGCLARGKWILSPRERIVNNLKKYDLWDEESPRKMKKLIILNGEMSQEHLGLSSEDYEWLINWAPAVFHVAAKVNWCEPYSSHFKPNVLGTRNVLRVAAEGRRKSFHYVSSIDVYAFTGSILGTEVVSEDGPLKVHLASHPFDTGYSQSQWVAEEMVQRVRNRGLPVAIYRPGFVLGDSKTAAGNPDDFIGRMVMGCIQLGYWPDLPQLNMEFVTADYVCDCILHIAAKTSSLGRAYNLTSGDPAKATFMDELCLRINEAGFPVKRIPYGEWVDRLREWDGLWQSPLLPLMPIITEPVLRGATRVQTSKFSPVYECMNTQRAVADRQDIQYVRVTPDLVKRHVDFWSKKGMRKMYN